MVFLFPNVALWGHVSFQLSMGNSNPVSLNGTPNRTEPKLDCISSESSDCILAAVSAVACCLYLLIAKGVSIKWFSCLL